MPARQSSAEVLEGSANERIKLIAWCHCCALMVCWCVALPSHHSLRQASMFVRTRHGILRVFSRPCQVLPLLVKFIDIQTSPHKKESTCMTAFKHFCAPVDDGSAAVWTACPRYSRALAITGKSRRRRLPETRRAS